jgi:hypothetical protein
VRPECLEWIARRGRSVWRYQSEAPADGTYGFPASPALIGDLVVIGGVDGKVYAFRQ